MTEDECAPLPPIRYSRGLGDTDNTPDQREAADFLSFREQVLGDRATAKRQQWIAGAFAVAPDDELHRTGGAGGSFARAIGSSHRCSACALPRRFIGLDIDGALTAESFGALVAYAQRWQGLIYTTASSTAEAPRCRVVVMLDQDADRALLMRASAALRNRIDQIMHNEGYPTPGWDSACDRPEQPLYLPLVDAETYRLDGEPLALATLLQEAPVTTPATASPARPELPQVVVGAEVVADLRSALATIPADDRATWIAMCAALRELGAVGRGLWIEWSQTSTKWQPSDARTWDTVGHSHTGYAAVFAMAQGLGWVNPRSGAAAPTAPADDIPGSVDADGTEAAWRPATDPCTHAANAQRLIYHFGDQLLYVNGVGWHVWYPPWRPDEMGALRASTALGRIVAAEAEAMRPWVFAAPSAKERQRRLGEMNRRLKWARDSEFHGAIVSALKLARTQLALDARELDANPSLLGLPSGVLELNTGTVRAHQQRDCITRVAGCDYDATATAPTWSRFLEEIMGGDADLLEYLQRLAGYTLTGHRGEHVLPVLWGGGANGKSTFLGVLQALLGEYAGAAAPGLLMTRIGNEHPTALADLQGKRLVIASETGESGKLNEDLVKLLTGGDAVSARRMRQDFYEFQPTHQLILQTNHRPRIIGTDNGIWRRLCLVPFVITVPPEKRDASLPARLRAELPGVLNWALKGLRRYQASGLLTPQLVQAATAEYRSSSDVVGTFIAECCEENPFFTAGATELYRAYVQWCEDNGEHARSQKDFSQRLIERGYKSSRGAGGRKRFDGIGLATGEAYQAIRGGGPRGQR